MSIMLKFWPNAYILNIQTYSIAIFQYTDIFLLLWEKLKHEYDTDFLLINIWQLRICHIRNKALNVWKGEKAFVAELGVDDKMTEVLEELKNEHAVDKTSWETLRV